MPNYHPPRTNPGSPSSNGPTSPIQSSDEAPRDNNSSGPMPTINIYIFEHSDQPLYFNSFNTTTTSTTGSFNNAPRFSTMGRRSMSSTEISSTDSLGLEGDTEDTSDEQSERDTEYIAEEGRCGCDQENCLQTGYQVVEGLSESISGSSDFVPLTTMDMDSTGGLVDASSYYPPSSIHPASDGGPYSARRMLDRFLEWMRSVFAWWRTLSVRADCGDRFVF